MSLDAAVQGALRAHREDETDPGAFVRLVVALWRSGGLDRTLRSVDRPRSLMVLFRLSGGLSRKEIQRGQSHPWGSRTVNRSRRRQRTRWHRGLWWTVASGEPWGEAPDPWITPATDAGDTIFFSNDYSKRFDGAGELADYLLARLLEWRAFLPSPSKRPTPEPEVVPCPTRLGPSRMSCALPEGHQGEHAWRLG